MITSFPPLIDGNSRVMLLGTMPGVQSLLKQEYYGNSSNQFWKIMFHLLDEELTDSTPYETKKNLLLDNRIALWDVLALCQREGSADSAIKKETANDFDSLFLRYQYVRHIFFTSRNAENYYKRLVGKQQGFTYYTLPSPSTAHARMNLQQKIVSWKIITNTLGVLNK